MQDYRFIFYALLFKKTVSLNENMRVIWDTFVKKWHINSILFFVAMVSQDILTICEPKYLEISKIKISFFLFLLATFLSHIPPPPPMEGNMRQIWKTSRVDSGRAIHSGRAIQLSLNKSNEQYKCHLMNWVITVWAANFLTWFAWRALFLNRHHGNWTSCVELSQKLVSNMGQVLGFVRK